MRVVFLDIDGTLVRQVAHRPWDRAPVAALNRVLDATGAVVVISSGWRLSARRCTSTEADALALMAAVCAEEGVRAPVIGMTPTLDREIGSLVLGRPRRDEIAAWLAQHPEVTRWCALDDDTNAGPNNLVLCDERVGLTEMDTDRAIAILEGRA